MEAALLPPISKIDSMKLQLSLEVQLYLSLAGISLLVSLLALARYSTRIASLLGSYGISEFVEVLSNDIASGSSSFNIHLPRGLCNSTLSGNRLITKYGAFYLPYYVVARNSTFCPDSRSVSLRIVHNNTLNTSEIIR